MHSDHATPTRPPHRRRRRHYALGSLLGLTILGGQWAPTQCAPPPPAVAPIPPALQEVIDHTNAERAAAGLPALSVDQRLMNAAQGHSQDQANRDRMSHNGSDGSTVSVRVERQGYSWAWAAENVAMGYPNASSVVNAWMDSRGHRENILRSTVSQIGVGLAYSADGTPYWTEVFAAPR